jgi:hypothetical protein
MVAGLTAYDRGRNTLLIEKSPLYGGSSARSGGGLWIPNNHFMPALGIQDSPEEAFAYLKGTARGAVPDDRLRALVDVGPEMLRYLCEHTRTRFDPMPEYPDYYPEIPGWRPGGRSVEAMNSHARVLGDEFVNMREVVVQALIMGRVAMTIKQARHLLCRGPGCVPAYLVFDAEFRRKYPCGPLLQGSQRPDWLLPKRLKREYLKKADTIDGLAPLPRRGDSRAVRRRQLLGLDCWSDLSRTGLDTGTGNDLRVHRGAPRNE